jgi:hypothetical protein
MISICYELFAPILDLVLGMWRASLGRYDASLVGNLIEASVQEKLKGGRGGLTFGVKSTKLFGVI